jgi:membrane protease YdiL (CAAX protease family)
VLDQAPEPPYAADVPPDQPSPELPRSIDAAPNPEGASPPIALPRHIQPVERLGALIEVFLCSGFPTQLLVFAALSQVGLRARTAEGGLAPPFIVAWALIDMTLILGLVWVFLRAHGEPVRQFVLGNRPPAREITLGLLLIPTAFFIVVLVLAVALTLRPSLNNVPVNPFESMMHTRRDAAIFAVVVTLAGGVREEVQRGFIIRRFDRYLGGGPIGILLYSIVFGLGHIEQGYAAAIATGSLGAVWGFVYYRRRSIVAPMISHAGFNLGQLVKYVTLAAR